MHNSPETGGQINLTAELLPKDASDNARRVALSIGNPLTLPGVDSNVRDLLRRAIEAGDAHGMLDAAIMASGQAESKSGNNPGGS